MASSSILSPFNESSFPFIEDIFHILAENKDIIKETIDTARSLTSINITMQLLSWDVFWGSLLAIPTGLMVMKKAKPENNGLSQS